MKAHLTKVSLALLSMVFLFGCQEQGSGPVGLEGLGPEFTHKNGEHGKGGGGGGGGKGPRDRGTFVDVTMGGGMTGIDSMLLRLNDGGVNLKTATAKGTKENYFDFTMNMTHTRDAASIVNNEIAVNGNGDILKADGGILCERTGPDQPPDNKVRELFGKLVQTEAKRFVLATIDTDMLGAPSLDHTIRISLDIRLETPTVDRLSGDIETDTFKVEFSGVIQLDVTNKHPDHFHLVCDIQPGDEITFDVTPR